METKKYNPFKLLVFFPILLFFLICSPKIEAWNEDYNPEYLPTTRTVCVEKFANLNKKNILGKSVQPDESCSKNEERYTFIIGKEPKGSVALIPILTKTKYSPDWVVSWPPKDPKNPRLWHFTCLKGDPLEILGVQTKKFKPVGEITSPVKEQSCESALMTAREVCFRKLKGNEIFEKCSPPDMNEF
jgi:hypothetical protein